MDGNSLNPEWPSLAGQHESYIVKSLQSFKSGARQNVLMSSMALPLTDEDMAGPGRLLLGRRSARAASPIRRWSAPANACTAAATRRRACPPASPATGPTGLGNPAAGWPAIAGQHATYSAAQLTAYRAKQRATDGDTQMMRNVSAMLTDDEIKAVASYIQGLR